MDLLCNDTFVKRQRFYRILTCAIDFGRKAKQQLLKNYIDTDLNQISFHDFLDRNQHVLYHLCFTRTCCRCSSKHIGNKKVLRPAQYEILYQRNSVNRLPGHNSFKSHDFCCCEAKQNVVIEELDITLMHCVIINCCVNIFWKSCLNQGNLEQFLNDNKHEIFHMNDKNRCFLCPNSYKFPDPKHTLHEADLCQLYNPSPVVDLQHAAATKGISTADLNGELSCIILNVLCPLKINVEKILNMRNEICHAKQTELDEITFEEKWAELEKNLLLIAKECGTDAEMKENLEKLKKITFEELFRKLDGILQDLQQKQEQFDNLVTKTEEVHTISKILETRFNAVINLVIEKIERRLPVTVLSDKHDIVTYTLEAIVKIVQQEQSIKRLSLCNVYQENNQITENAPNDLGLKAVGISSTCIKALWYFTENNDGKYQLSVSMSNSTKAIKEMTVFRKTDCLIDELDPDTEYDVLLRVPCLNNLQSKVSARTQKSIPNQLIVLTARMTSKTELHVSWWSLKETDHTVQYRIDQREKKTQPLELPVTINKKEKTISDLEVNCKYEVRVAALDVVKYFSPWTTVLSQEEWARIPKRPTGLRIKKKKDKINLQWSTQSCNVDWYIVGSGIRLEGKNINKIGEDKLESEFTDLCPNTEYTFSVRACNQYGNSEPACIQYNTGDLNTEDIGGDAYYYVKDKLKCWKCGNESFSTKKYQNHKNTCRQQGTTRDDGNNFDTDMTKDALTCGKCENVSDSLKKYLKHRTSCRKQTVTQDENVKSFWNGAFVLDVKVSDTEVENMNNSKNKLSTAGIQLTYVTKGSLVLWTKISKELFVDKEVFLSSLNVFFGNIFENSRLEAQPKTQVDIQLEIPDEDFDDVSFTCKRCQEVFLSLDGFTDHMTKTCKRKHPTQQGILAEQNDTSGLSSSTISNLTEMTSRMSLGDESSIKKTSVEPVKIHDLDELAEHHDQGMTEMCLDNENASDQRKRRKLYEVNYTSKVDQEYYSSPKLTSSREYDREPMISIGGKLVCSREQPKIERKDMNKIEVSWKAPTNSSNVKCNINYDVQMLREVQSPIKTARTAKTSCTIDELTADVEYRLRISTHSNVGQSETEPIDFSLPALAPRIPMDPPILEEIEENLFLYWEEAKMCRTRTPQTLVYTVEMSLDNEGEDWKSIETELTHVTPTSCCFEDKYTENDCRFRVFAVTNIGQSEPTNPVALKRPFEPPIMPENELFVKIEGTNSIHLWSKPAKIEPHMLKYRVRYSIEISTDNGNEWYAYETNLKEPSYQITEIDLDSPYQFRIRAYNIFGGGKATQPYDIVKEREKAWIKTSNANIITGNRKRKNIEILISKQGDFKSSTNFDVDNTNDTDHLKSHLGSHIWGSSLLWADNIEQSKTELAKFDCSVTIAVPWIDSYENLYSKPCKIFKTQFKDKMTLMYLEQFPKPNILVSTEITDMRQGSMVVYYCVFIQFPENCPVTAEDLFEATRNGLKKRTNDGNSAWLFKHMDPESIQVTEKIDSDYGNLYKGAQAPVNTRIAEANQQDVNICEELSIDLPKRHQNVHVTNCICIGDVFVYTDHANCEIVSCPFNLNTMLPLRGFSCPLDKQPLDLVVVGTSDVAVMFENSIQEFEVYENGRIIPKKSLNLGINCSIAIWQNVWYLAKFDNDMLLINICDREGKQIKQVNVCQLPDSSISINIQVHLTVRGGIYCSVFNPSYAEELKRHTVYCYDKNGHEIWQFNDEILRRVTGIAIDRYDNIYLANGKKLIIISPDGNYYKLLHDPIQHPSSLFFHDQDKRLISTSKSGNIQILNVNYTNTF